MTSLAEVNLSDLSMLDVFAKEMLLSKMSFSSRRIK